MATQYDSYTSVGATISAYAMATTRWETQTFTPLQEYTIGSFSFELARSNTSIAAGIIYGAVQLVANSIPDGTNLGTSQNVYVSTLPVGTSNADWTNFSLLTTIALQTTNQYAVIIKATSLTSSFSLLRNVTGTYTGGKQWDSITAGASWTEYANSDLLFITYGPSNIVPDTDKVYTKRLIAVGDNQIWYGSTISTLAELTAARDDINCIDKIECVYGLQKLFVANVSTYRILDFANIALPTGEIGVSGVSAPLRGLTLTGGTSGAKIISDFCTVATGSANVYGYKITTANFSSGETVTGGASNTVSFTLAAAQITAPHWYTWTPQFNDTTNYYTMPSKATLVCLYCGRIVLSGNIQSPQQWYMSRVLDSFNWLYVVNDPLTAIRGGNADAGEVGDIIKALIPYQDDYLIFGCANSMWLLRGDPASGGSVQPIIETTGIFGNKAWCFDDSGNLYFFGQNGFYQIPIGQFSVENLSELALPEWIKDWNLDEDLHRIVLTFDPIKRGIIISKTLLSDGTNSNYWYDFKIQGFYPESYPLNCGVFCSHFYNSTDGDYKKLLLGCNDGYIRGFDESTKGDELTSGTTAINSYLALPIEQLSQDISNDGKLTSFTVETAGGAAGSQFGDSDSVIASFYRGQTAEAVLESIKNNDAAFLTVALVSTGKFTFGPKIRGPFLGIKFSNNTSGETWAINRLYGNVEEAR